MINGLRPNPIHRPSIQVGVWKIALLTTGRIIASHWQAVALKPPERPSWQSHAEVRQLRMSPFQRCSRMYKTKDSMILMHPSAIKYGPTTRTCNWYPHWKRPMCMPNGYSLLEFYLLSLWTDNLANKPPRVKAQLNRSSTSLLIPAVGSAPPNSLLTSDSPWVPVMMSTPEP